jgi:hypothetical protein
LHSSLVVALIFSHTNIFLTELIDSKDTTLHGVTNSIFIRVS